MIIFQEFSLFLTFCVRQFFVQLNKVVYNLRFIEKKFLALSVHDFQRRIKQIEGTAVTGSGLNLPPLPMKSTL